MKSLYIFFCCFLFLPFWSLAQIEQEADVQSLDSLYREDQFYLGFTYNILTKLGPDISSSGFSGGFQAGIIRDMPLNEKRNIALGLGIGWSIRTYGQTLFIGEEVNSGKSIFLSLDEEGVEYSRNRFSTQSIEVPLQFRWRTSTPESHRFWRIYSGIEFGYIYYFKSRFEQPGNEVIQTDVPEFNRFRLGATFAFGYNTFNFHFYYGLNSFFSEDARINGSQVEMSNVRIGLMFYIL